MFTTLGVVSTLGAHHRKLARRIGDMPVLHWVLRRLSEAQQLDRLVLLTGKDAQSESILGLVPPDVAVYRSARPDLLGRLDALLAHMPSQAVVLVPADTPFVDPALVDRLVTEAAEHPECDYICYAGADGRPLDPETVGLFGQWVRAEVLRRLHQRLTASEDRQHPIRRYLLSHSGVYVLRLLTLPRPVRAQELRLRMQWAEDWEHLQAIYEALGPDQLDWAHIVQLLEDQPEIRRQMAQLNRKEAVSSAASPE